MNWKLQLHKERLQRMLMLIQSQEEYEDLFDFDTKGIKEHEEQVLVEYAAEFAALNQLATDQISNAKPLFDFTVNENLIANHFTPVS